MKKYLSCLLFGALTVLPLAAQEKPAHQVRLGWGDMLFETAAFHPGATTGGRWMHDFGYTGHIFAEYRYRIGRVVGLGLQTDFESILWKETECDFYGRPVGETLPVRNYDVSILPTVQFTFLNKEWVELYAGVGSGILVAFDNARQVELAPVVDVTLLGVWMGKGHWGGALEIGGMSAMRGTSKIYMALSRMVSVSFNYRW